MNQSNPSIVIFGAGNIGRGFIGQLFSQAKYEVIFVDAVESLVGALNEAGQYPIFLVSEEGNQDLMIGPVRALLISDQDAVNEAVAAADIMATAVGVPILPHIAGPIAKALQYRSLSDNIAPLDILVCENKMDAAEYLKKLILSENPSLDALLEDKIGFVETSIGRMVPVLSAEDRKKYPLMVRTEPYMELPVDAAGFKGAIPAIPTLIPFAPFHYYHQRKLYIHNMGHALTAYLGWLIGCGTIAQAIEVPEIRALAEHAMRQVGEALSKEYGVPMAELEAHIQDLLHRFANRQLGDNVQRVGRDPMRKLSPDDRLVGSLLYTLSQGIEPFYIAAGIAAAFQFLPEDDSSAEELSEMVRRDGLEQVLKSYCLITGSETLDHWRHLILAQDALLRVLQNENKRGSQK